MANNISALKSELLTLLTNTTNLDAATKTKLRNRVVAAYQYEWDQRVASGTTDNATNRGIFLVDKWVEFLSDIYKEQSNRENVAALPPPETL